MSIYKKGIIVSAILLGVSLMGALILNYIVGELFWCNVMLGVFGGAVLNLISSILGYFTERRTAMEEFYIESLKLSKRFNRYQKDLSLDQKIDFFLNMSDFDISYLDNAYRKIDLFSRNQKKYIYDKIYKRLVDCYNKVCSYSLQFRMHVNGTGRNEAAMDSFVKEIENYILCTKKYEVAENDSDISMSLTNVENKIVKEIIYELDGNYYCIMYGRKARKKEKKK